MKLKYLLPALFILSGCLIKHNPTLVHKKDVVRLVSTLSADDMEGRAAFSPGVSKAADFISSEFKKAGLIPINHTNFRQTFNVKSIQPTHIEVTIDGIEVSEENVLTFSDQPGLQWNTNPEIDIVEIKKGENFVQRFRSITEGNSDALVIVDPSFSSYFKNPYFKGERITMSGEANNRGSKVFVIHTQIPHSFRVSLSNSIEEKELFNIVGVLKGKSKADEIIVFSAHYDHIGIIDPINQDSIANGADDDASGVSAIISLANAFAKQDNNERTLIFVAFTAEEIGGYGSRYFSKQVNPDDIKAMINIEMIGKDSKFGPNSLYITGYERSDLGKIMQKNVKGTNFKFYPDPYPEQNLFYRSDNATLAALGVPAHSFSTVQIPTDQYYHTVEDEFSTLDAKNIVSSIKAIFVGTKGLVDGTETPSRVEKLK